MDFFICVVFYTVKDISLQWLWPVLLSEEISQTTRETHNHISILLMTLIIGDFRKVFAELSV